MSMKQLVQSKYLELIENLKSGDEIIEGGTYDRPIRMSKKTGEARVSFINTIRQLLNEKKISLEEANMATNLFGRKTTKLYWCKS